MLTIYGKAHSRHHGVELKDGRLSKSFESPRRAETILQRICATNLGDVISPHSYDASHYTRAHSGHYVDFLAKAWGEWKATGRTGEALPLVWPVRDLKTARLPNFIDGKLGFFSMDAGAPIGEHTWEAVAESANVALTGIDLIHNRAHAVFALCRPPGHHAGREYAGGYCYLNNAAIAAERALANGARRVAIIDVDFHHGNGTQDIFYARNDVLFASLHGDPNDSYPYFAGYADEAGEGVGYGYNLNLPLPHGTAWAEYSAALAHVVTSVCRFAADVLIVSLGVDTFEDDPISHFRLKTEDYLRMGEMLASMALPTLFVMEGGYLVDAIGTNAVNVLQGYEGAR
ncbi:histone deacetylase family protein [Trinickia sp.]|uniref:histone deacetylase family protein n=1 Tax=Trinickia sp. TaxID=2571163 RepID=UPI003F7EA258